MWACEYCGERINVGYGCDQDNDQYRDVWNNEYKCYDRVHLDCWKDKIISSMVDKFQRKH